MTAEDPRNNSVENDGDVRNAHVSISGGTFTTQGALSIGAGSRATVRHLASGPAAAPLPEVLQPDEIDQLRERLSELERQVNGSDPNQADEAESVLLQARLLQQALEAPAPRRRTVLGLVNGMAETSKALTGVGEFVSRLITLITTGTF